MSTRAAGTPLSSPISMPSAPPRVTVVTPTYNRAGWLRESISSVLAQSFREFTLLVADNASTDETPEVVREFGDPRIVYRRRPENVGLVENHNLAVAEVESEYCLILPDDDVVYPRHLERTVAVLDANPRAGMVHARFDLLGPDGDVLGRDVDWAVGLRQSTVESGLQYLRESMLWSCRVNPSTALMRMAALPRPLFDTADFPPVDVALWLRIAVAWDMAFVAETLGAYRIHVGSHSAAQGTATLEGNAQSPELIERIEAVKLRFLDGDGRDLPDRGELRRRALWSTRRGLAASAPTARGRLGALISASWEAAWHDPGVYLRPGSLRLAAQALAGPARVSRCRRLLRAGSARRDEAADGPARRASRPAGR